MKFETYLLLGILVYGIWRTNRSVQRSQTVAERNFTVRTSVFLWFLGLLVLGGILLLLIPVFVGAVTLAKLLRDARGRLRQQAQERVDLERMRRVN